MSDLVKELREVDPLSIFDLHDKVAKLLNRAAAEIERLEQRFEGAKEADGQIIRDVIAERDALRAELAAERARHGGIYEIVKVERKGEP
jgi:hypothetical protein